jgi:hypothetical protein
MTFAANILAFMLLIVVPFVQPCVCADFTLFCKCDARAAACEDVCCSLGCHSSQDDPQPLPSRDKPCDAPLAPELVNSVFSAAVTAVAQPEAIHAPVFEFAPSDLARTAQPVLWSKPPPTSLIVARTSFLRI